MDIRQQIAADPRVQAIEQSRRRGSIPGRVRADELRALGYRVPDDYVYVGQGARMPGHVYDDRDAWDTGLGIAGGTLLGLGTAGVLGVGPLAGSGSAAASASGGLPATGGFDGPIGTMVGQTATGGSVPLGGVTAGSAAGAASAAAPSLGRRILDQVLTPQGLATLAGTIGGIATSGGGIEDDPNAKALLEMALKRQQRTDPLHDSVTRLANAMLPTAYQSGR